MDKLRERIKRFFKSQAEFARKIEISPNVFYRKMKTGDFSYDEILKMDKYLHISDCLDVNILDIFPLFCEEKIIYDILKYQSIIKRDPKEFFYLTRKDLKGIVRDDLVKILNRVIFNIVCDNAELLGMDDMGREEVEMLSGISNFVFCSITCYEKKKVGEYGFKVENLYRDWC